jgi:hypothetical protein
MSNYAAPYSYDFINQVNGTVTPSTIHVQDSLLTAYFRKYLLQKVLSVFEWKMPETWSKDYFLYTLFGYGYLAIVNTDKYGVIPQQCGLQGFDIFYRPTHAIITNPLLTGFLNPRIDKQCVIIKVQPDYGSMMDIVNYYAAMMALSVETASTNLLNSKLSFVFAAENKQAAESFKKMYDNISSGEPAVVIDKSLFKADGSKQWELFNQNVGQNYIVSEILADLRKWENMFNTDIGIANANTDKKERLVVAEVEANNEETTSKASLWLEQMQEACKKARDMFDIELSVYWREKPQPVEPEKKEAE